jgi:hypothetical protein
MNIVRHRPADFCDNPKPSRVYTDETLLHGTRSQGILPRPFPIASLQNAHPQRSQDRLANLKLATLQFFQPGVLSVLALALIVGGWSYGRKLSHYLHNPDLTKASTTRMWVDHRNDSIAAPVLRHQTPHKFLTPQFLVVAVPAVPHFTRQQIIAEPVQSHATLFISPLHPLRAPPVSSSLA